MSSKILTVPSEVRYATDFEIREADGQYVEARATTYEQWYDVGPFEEIMTEGVFDTSLSRSGDNIKLMVRHDARAMAVATPVEWRKEADGLVGVWKFGSHDAAMAAHTAAREGLFGGVSVGFNPGKGEKDSEWLDKGRVRRNQARLLEVSLVSVGANPDAILTEVRSAGVPTDVLRRLPKTPRLDDARRILDRLIPIT